MSNTQFKYTRNIKLGPAIGDWTTIQFKDLDVDDIQISSVRNINFDSLPRNEMKEAHMLHYKLAERITAKLSNDLTAKVELHSIQANQMSYSDFLESQKNQKIVQSKFSLGTIGKMDVILDWALSEMLVDRLLGGKGTKEGKSSFSGMELKILNTQLEELVPLFSQSWGNVFSESSVSGEFSTGEYVQDKKLSLREAFILFSLNFYFIDQNLQTITFAYPNHVVKSLLKQKNLLNEPIQKRVNLKESTEKQIKIPLKAYVGDAKLTMKELRNLQAGDMIPLSTGLESPLKVVIGSNTEVFGQVGVANGKMSVQLLDLGKHAANNGMSVRNTGLQDKASAYESHMTGGNAGGNDTYPASSANPHSAPPMPDTVPPVPSVAATGSIFNDPANVDNQQQANRASSGEAAVVAGAAAGVAAATMANAVAKDSTVQTPVDNDLDAELADDFADDYSGDVKGEDTLGDAAINDGSQQVQQESLLDQSGQEQGIAADLDDDLDFDDDLDDTELADTGPEAGIPESADDSLDFDDDLIGTTDAADDSPSTQGVATTDSTQEDLEDDLLSEDDNVADVFDELDDDDEDDDDFSWDDLDDEL